jgi:hypothetical protein
MLSHIILEAPPSVVAVTHLFAFTAHGQKTAVVLSDGISLRVEILEGFLPYLFHEGPGIGGGRRFVVRLVKAFLERIEVCVPEDSTYMFHPDSFK